MSNFSVLIKDGQGTALHCGSPKKAVKQAAQMSGCKPADIEIINAWNLDQPCYLFDSTAADADYWLAALKLDGDPSYIGKPAS